MPSGQLISPTSINDLPLELKQLIASFLTNHDPLQASQDILKLRTLSREWNPVVLSYLKRLWNEQVKKGWITHFLMREEQLKPKLLDFFQRTRSLDFPALVDERDRMSLSLRTRGIRADAVLTHLVIRRKIELLKQLIHDAGLVVPESLQNFPSISESESEVDRELELEIALQEIEQMAGGKKQMSASQKRQIKKAIADCLAAKEHTKSQRGSTRQKHQEALARRQAEKWNRSQRIFQSSGFQAALDDAKRC